MSEVVRVVRLDNIESFSLKLSESAKYEKALEDYGFIPSTLVRINEENYVLWEKKIK